jgi:lipopolysaccharide biosynthesis glycosyltransferase
MGKIPVILTFDKRIILAASVAIKSLIDSAKETTCYDIRILHSDLNLKTQEKLNELTKNTNHSIAFHYVDKTLFNDLQISKGSWREIF